MLPDNVAPRDRRRLSPMDFVAYNGTQEFPPPWKKGNTSIPVLETSPAPKRWGFIHIPKTAGDSFLKDAPKHMPVISKIKGNVERSYWATDRTQPLVVFLRKPTAHVLSQFLECKYDEWGQIVTNNTGFPGYLELDDVLAGFDEWIRDFQYHAHHPDAFRPPFSPDGYTRPFNAHYDKRQGFQCYDPFNMQSRYMTMEQRYQLPPHLTYQPHHRFPDIHAAIQNLNTIQVVGIVEYYSTSLCLFEFYAGGKQFLTPECQQPSCEQQKLILSNNHTHVTHGVPRHSVRMISNETLRIIQGNMTRVDQQLYQVGLAIFFRKVDEVWNATGIDLLCRPETRPWSPPKPKPSWSTTIPTVQNFSLDTQSLFLSIVGQIVFLAVIAASRRCRRRRRKNIWPVRMLSPKDTV